MSHSLHCNRVLGLSSCIAEATRETAFLCREKASSPQQPVQLRLEFHERYGQGEINRETALKDRKRSSTGTQSSLEAPKSCGVELDELPLPVTGSYSTDNLVRIQSWSSFDGGQTRGASTKSKEPAHETKHRPDYKSISLRWPFLTFLIVLIVGLFAFLEYQIHDLPPMHYSMIKLDAPESHDALVSDINVDDSDSTAITPSRMQRLGTSNIHGLQLQSIM